MRVNPIVPWLSSDWTGAPFLPHELCCRTEIMYQHRRGRLRTMLVAKPKRVERQKF